jgi:LPXTG-motif cell wall-anchored protein
MKKLMLMAAMMGVALVVAAPAIAQVSQEESERRITSGKASPSFSVSNKGDNANLCPTGQQATNTGNVANEQGVVQYNSTADDLDFTGSSLTIEPSTTAECTQTIEQSTAAGPKAEAKAGEAEAKGGGGGAPSGGGGAPSGGAGAGGGGGGQLPATGGISPLMMAGTGVALLIGGGLLVRRMIR